MRNILKSASSIQAKQPRKPKEKKSAVALDETTTGHTAKKADCPHCRAKKRYVRYWDSEKNEYLPNEFGKCDREENCGYHNKPWEWLKANRPQETNTMASNKPYVPQATQGSMFKQPKAVDKKLVGQTLAFYDSNNLIVYLRTVLGEALTKRMCEDYFIGTGKEGATIFWQMDMQMRVRTGQRIIYNSEGHRDKSIEPKRLFVVAEGYTPCMFGEHLLYTKGAKMPIAIVESEKTAAIASVYLPEINGRKVIWMAASGVYGLTDDKIGCLSGCEVILVPDFSFHARAIWGLVPMRKATKNIGSKVVTVVAEDGELVADYIPVCDRLRRAGAASVTFFDPFPEIKDSTDLADYLLKSAPPQPLAEPNYEELSLPEAIYATLSHADLARFNDLHKVALSYPQGEKEFKIAYNEENRPIIHSAAPVFDTYLEKFFTNPAIMQLAKGLDICTGTIEYINTNSNA